METSQKSDFDLAQEKLCGALPELLQDPKNLGRWVGFSKDGLIAEGDDDLSVIAQCEQHVDPDEFAIGCVVPDSGWNDLIDSKIIYVDPGPLVDP
mgnify:CR=1 FL=1